MQDKRDVDVSFRHMFCIHRMALQTMHRVNGVVRCVLYLFYFLALPFYNPFIYNGLILFIFCAFARKSLHYPGMPPDNVRLDIQQLLLAITFAGQFFGTLFFLGDFTDATYICAGSNWNQTTNNQVFVDTNQFVG